MKKADVGPCIALPEELCGPLLVHHEELVRKEWYFCFNNQLKMVPQLIDASSTVPAYWKCPKCGSIYHMSPRERIRCWYRHQESCYNCRGRVQLHAFTV